MCLWKSSLLEVIVVSRSKNKVSLEPPFKTKRSRMQGKRIIKVVYAPGAIKVDKEKEPAPVEEDGSGYTRSRVFDSWEC